MAAKMNIRIYDLAKEVKQDAKLVIRDLQRAGADVSVASNSVPKELADAIRKKYVVQIDKTPVRTIKVIKKKAVKIAEESEMAEPIDGEAAGAVNGLVVDAQKADMPTAPVEISDAKDSQTKTKRLVLKKVKAPEEKDESSVQVAGDDGASSEPKTAVAEPASKDEVIREESPTAAPVIVAEAQAGGTRIKRLKLTKDALESGLKPGERIASPEPSAPDLNTARPRAKGKPGRRGANLRGTEGETATPKTVYTPPPTHGRKFGRRGRKGGFAARNRTQAGDTEAPQKRTIEERILDQVGEVDDANLREIRLTEGATIREFAEGIGVTPRDIVQLLVKQGVFATLNQPMAEETALEIGTKFGCAVVFVPFEEMVIEEEFEDIIASDSDDEEFPRAPVVTVMGHVDHGKTSLLDAIRSENVAEGEAGGITQHIGAYSVHVQDPDNKDEERRVVFLDTPGHEAFTMMRARGAKATDVVVLVVAADDGVMPQTIEAIEHSKAAGVPIIIAINKIDKPGANPEKVKAELAERGLNSVEWGGDVEMVSVSAIKHENLDTLLETILLTTDILELKASATRRASGIVLEAKLDKGRGAVGTILIQQGTLQVGDPFIVGQYHGKVRAMFSDMGEKVLSVAPATPVEILGLQGVPNAGDVFQAVSDIDKAQTIANTREQQARQVALSKSTRRGIESLGLSDIKELLVILKADVQGSVEVMKTTLEKLSTDNVTVRVIRSAVGAITESDVLLASATQAEQASTAVVIVGFNVRPGVRAADTAKQEDVDIRLHSIIYKVEDEIRAAMVGMLDAIEKELILGKALVQEIYKVSKVGTIAGCKVTEGLIRRNAKARLIRDGVVIWDGDISTLKRFKDDATEVKQGFECGLSLLNYNDIKVGDEIEAFVIEEIAATEKEL